MSGGQRHARRLLVALLALGGCGEVPGRDAAEAARHAEPPSETELAAGRAVYERFCIGCHGPEAAGTPQGPPLVHRVYEPRHHADYAFVLAIRQGVRAHHWRFGDMPPVEGISDEETRLVIAYVRHLQRQAGIF